MAFSNRPRERWTASGPHDIPSPIIDRTRLQASMTKSDTDTLFAGFVPKLYERHLVPMVFGPFAPDLVRRLEPTGVSRVLEVAAGTGVVTRELAAVLPADVAIVATDLNQTMVDHAQEIWMQRPIEWQQADAMALPFDDESFDAVVCQFGVMFFSDKPTAFAEVRRVLRPGGTFLFNVWDRIEDNDFVHTVTEALTPLFPEDPPRFHARVPHGYHTPEKIAEDLRAGGFTNTPQMETVTAVSQARAPWLVAMGYCQGTPLRNEIEERDASLLGEATAMASKALIEKFGPTNISGKLQAIVISVRK
jgi:SAM-dependent methyltransferase